MNFTAQQIANILGGAIEGNPNAEVNSVAKIEEGCIGNLCFLANEKYTHHIYTTNASVIIVNNSFHLDQKIKATLIKVDDAYSSFSQLLEVYNKMKFDKVGLSDKAVICTNFTVVINTNIWKNDGIISNSNILPNVTVRMDFYIVTNNYTFTN